MVEFFAQTRKTEVQEGRVVFEFVIPAFSQNIARRRAQRLMGGKGFDNSRIENIQVEETGDAPGQEIYAVRVSSPR